MVYTQLQQLGIDFCLCGCVWVRAHTHAHTRTDTRVLTRGCLPCRWWRIAWLRCPGPSTRLVRFVCRRCASRHTYMHISIRTHTPTHTHPHPHPHTFIHTHIHTSVNTYMHTCIHMHACMQVGVEEREIAQVNTTLNLNADLRGWGLPSSAQYLLKLGISASTLRKKQMVSQSKSSRVTGGMATSTHAHDKHTRAHTHALTRALARTHTC